MVLIRYHLLLAGLLLFLSACASLPLDYPRPSSAVLSDTGNTRLGQAVAGLMQDKQQGKSGFYPLPDGLAAFAARMTLIETAERSVDLQYYIWNADDTGKLLIGALVRAADRGVRIRLLLDDFTMKGKDLQLAAIDSHPNIEVRLFNPFVNRGLRMLEMVLHFGRLNRRMHNKSLTVDNQATIVGGRNIGDEYFAAHGKVNFQDTDVIAIGPIVGEVSRAFDRYWADQASIPVPALGLASSKEQTDSMRSDLQAHIAAMQGSEYGQSVRHSNVVPKLANRELPLYWALARLVVDDPVKIRNKPADDSTHLRSKMQVFFQDLDNSVLVISPYFVPGKTGLRQLSGWSRQGIRVRILTNSLASIDSALAFSGYAPYRVPLLEAGVELYEMKPVSSGRPAGHNSAYSGSSGASLHAKMYVFDKKRVFVGSYNLDQRSANLNTEMGIVFESPQWAEAIHDKWDRAIGDAAYRLQLVEAGPGVEQDPEAFRAIEWVTGEGTEEARFAADPGVSIWKRMMTKFGSILPLEGQL